MRKRGLIYCVVLLAGCTRTHYRQSADREVYPIIRDRIVSPSAEVGRTNILPGPGSRLYDPFNPDHPPKPPDDLVAARYMDHPYRFQGSRKWGKDGIVGTIEFATVNGDPATDPLGLCSASKENPLKLSQELALDAALVNSREYQTAMEDVYLSALALTLNRFEFDARWFATNTGLYTTAAANQAGMSTDLLSNTTNVGFNKAFAAGGQLIVDFANSVVVNLSGTGQANASSNLLIAFSQPLLRGAGKRVRLESLTQAERDVLYATRNFARFRKQFWANITTSNGGYLDLLLALQNVRNQQANLRSQEQNYRLYQELFLGGKVSPVALDQVYQSFVTSRVSVASAEVSLQNLLDTYKLSLGIPTRTPVTLDDEFLDTFVLTDPKLETLRESLDKFLKDRAATIDAVPEVSEMTTFNRELVAASKELRSLAKTVAEELKTWSAKPSKAADKDERDRVETTRKDLGAALPDTLENLDKLDKDLAEKLPTAKSDAFDELSRRGRQLLTLSDEVIAVQTQVRVYRISLPELDWTEDRATAYARENRLDLQTSFGQTTDAWRRVTFAANALRGGLNINTAANLRTDPDNNRPFNFASEANSYTVGFQIDSPVNRLAERNAYRAALIVYHRARRNTMLLGDNIDRTIRFDLRGLQLAQLTFETSRQTLLSAARQLDSAKIRVLNQEANASSTSTLDILRAQDSLLSARNSLVGSYINYEQLRVQLLLDLEAIQLTPEGRPIDERSNIDLENPAPAERPTNNPTGPSTELSAPKKLPNLGAAPIDGARETLPLPRAVNR